MPEAAERAQDAWDTLIAPLPIGGDVLFTLHFKHREHPFKFLHGCFKSLHDARQEQKRLRRDLQEMRCDKFMEKYRIGYDLKGSLL